MTTIASQPVAFVCMRHMGVFPYGDYRAHMDEMHDGRSDCVGMVSTMQQVERLLSGESYTDVCCTIPVEPIENHVIEIAVTNHGPRLGIVENIPPRRVVALVSHKVVGSHNLWVLFTADGDRIMFNAAHHTFSDLGPARAGWMNW